MLARLEKIGPYEVEREIGRGGMGVVYLARDTKLDRPVAIKALPDEVAGNPERLARFEREAKILASLSDSNVAAIHGLEQVGTERYLILEYAEGPTLAELLHRHALPMDQALDICRQIAQGVEAAHDKGVIHRDLKPANITVATSGQVKILDFGLARLHEGRAPASGSLSDSPTAVMPASPTIPGEILGTAGYMSPEQARGRTVDKRSDIWAFGCVLYEALSGQQAFVGETVTDSIGATLHKEPEWEALPPTTPLNIRLLLRRCLTKKQDLRLHDIADARIELEAATSDEAELEPLVAVSSESGSRRLRKAVVLSVLVIAAALLGAYAAGVLRREEPTQPLAPVRLVVELPESQPLALARLSPLGLGYPSVALSRDGSRLVYAADVGGTSQLFLRPMKEFEARPIPGTEGAFHPFFSPDGNWVGFFTHGGKMKKVSVLGGEPASICEARNPRGVSWGPGDAIVFAQREGKEICRVNANGGRPEVVAHGGDNQFQWPQVLPGGKAAILAGVRVISLETGEHWRLFRGGIAHYVPTGHLLFTRSGILYAVGFDPDRLETSGDPVPVLSDVMIHQSGAVQLAVSEQGTLAYVPGAALTKWSLVWSDRQGNESPVDTPAQDFGTFEISPDGERLAIEIHDNGTDIWILELSRGVWSRLTFDGRSHYPLWMPDGDHLVFRTRRDGRHAILKMRADGSGEIIELYTSDHRLTLYSVFPDGDFLVMKVTYPDKGGSLQVLALEKDATAQVFLERPFSDWGAVLSPNGKWMAYTSDESGRWEVYVRPYPGPGRKWQVSFEGGEEPIWSPLGDELFYRNGDEFMTVSVTTDPDFAAAEPRLLIEGPYINVGGRSYAVSPDAKRLLFLKPERNETPVTKLHVVLNWFEELKQRTATD